MKNCSYCQNLYPENLLGKITYDEFPDDKPEYICEKCINSSIGRSHQVFNEPIRKKTVKQARVRRHFVLNPMKHIFTCANCGKEFETARNDQRKYCSVKCSVTKLNVNKYEK